MLRIVGLQRHELPEGEFLLLQNQGNMRLNLRGHAIISEGSLDEGGFVGASYAFADEVMIPPGMYVLLSTGHGENRWIRTKDGAHVYHLYMFRDSCVWSRCRLPLHVLSTQHTYCERGEPLLLR